MRILMVSPLPPPAGGIATWTKQYLEYCSRNDINVSSVNTSLKGRRAKSITSNRNYFSELNRTVSILLDLRKKLKSFSPDVVHINTNCSKFGIHRDLLCARLSRKYRKALVVHCRCNIEDQLGQSAHARWAFRKLANLASIVLTLNTPSLQFVHDVSSVNCRILPNFIQSNRVVSSRMINTSIKSVAFVGHVQRMKGVAEVIKLARRYPDVFFQLAGPISPEFEKVELPQNLNMLGELDHQKVIALMDEADVFLFPTYTEGFANALLEAMARGLPVITTDVGANMDMLEGRGGLIVPIGDVDQLAAAIETIMPQQAREEMSLWNIRKVSRNYTIDTIMKELMCIYKEVSD